MEAKLFDTLVAAIIDGADTLINLRQILLDEFYLHDDETPEADAEKLIESFIDDNFVEAEDVASRLNREAAEFLHERQLAARGW